MECISLKHLLLPLWQYREFIYSCVKRDFLARYQGSLFGILWAVFQPLSMIFVYTVIFSNVMKSKLAGMESVPYSYSIYLCAGVLTWGLFTEMVMNCTHVFLANGNLLKKVSFPRICLPAITVCSAIINFAIGFILFLLFLMIIGNFPWHAFWTIPLMIALQILFAGAMGIGLGVLNVFFRDVGQMLGVLLQFWFWFTPIVYPVQIVPEALRWLLEFNPMFHIIRGYQTVFLYDQLPEFFGMLAVFGLSIIIGAYSLFLYRKHVSEMVDEL